MLVNREGRLDVSIPADDDSSSASSFCEPSDNYDDKLFSGLEGFFAIVEYMDVFFPNGDVIGILRHLECLPKFRKLKDAVKIKKFYQQLVSLGQELKEFFRVPNQQIISSISPTPSRIQIIAAVVNFLLLMIEAILSFDAYSIASVKGLFQNLQAELDFLITFLGDTAMHLQTNSCIAIDIEVMVNEVAGFFYCFFFTICVFILIMQKESTEAVIKIEDIVIKVLSFLQSDPLIFLDNKGMETKETKKKEKLEEKKKVIIALVDEVRSFLNFFAISRNDQDLESGILDLSLSNLLRKFEILKTKIKEHCIAVSKMPSVIAPKQYVVSLFIIDSVIDDLMNLMRNKPKRIAIVYDQISTLHKELILLGSLVMDIAEQEEAEHEALLIRTINVAYEVEYVINSFPHVWYVALRLPQLIEKIQLITIAIHEKKSKIDAGGIQVVATNLDEQASLQLIEPPILEDIFVGFEKETIEILDQVVRGPSKLQIISIFGMPGLGKTTLATKLYNHPNVVLRFDVRGWCVVSQTYNKKNLLIDILMSICHLKRDTLVKEDDGSLAEKLHKSLKGRRYLVVIDDIWDINAWDDLRRYFPCDDVGSRILFTSRNKEVALEASASVINPLPFLSEVECWELLQWKVFHHERCPLELLDIGKQIAKSCYGLPLAVVVIAGVLAAMEKKELLWQKIARNLSSHILGNLDKTLELSYKYLPMHLKPCFLYFSVFGEDKEIPVRMLISLWISEGYINKGDNKILEDVAMEYVMKLNDRSLVIVEKRESDGRVKTCKIHDLLHKMCSRIAQEKDFMEVVNTKVYPQWFFQLSMYQQHQHLSIDYDIFGGNTLPFGLHLRTLVCTNLGSPIFISSSFKVLRIMRFHQDIDDPEVIGNEHLVNLRYLSISIPRSIKQLPLTESFQKLEFLLVEIEYKVQIPDIVLKMVSLREVDFKGGAYFSDSCRQQATKDEGLPVNVNLQSFFGLLINDERDEKILRCFPNLRRLKCAFGSSLNGFSFDHCNHLESLKLSLHYDDDHHDHDHDDNDDGGDHDNDYDEDDGYGNDDNDNYDDGYDDDEHEEEEEEEEEEDPCLRFPSSLKKLTVFHVSLSKEEMKVIGGLQYLEVLKLEYVTLEGGQWEVREDEFPELKFLKLDHVQLEQWNASSDNFPRLQRLVLQYCYNMIIPTSLGDIPTLEMIKVYACSQDVKYSAREIQEEQEENGNEVLKVVIIPL